MEASANADETMDVGRYVVFAIDDLRLAVDLAAVARVTHAVEIQPLAGAPESIAGTVVIRGERIAVIDTRRRLGLSPREIELSDRMVLVECGERRWLLLADAVIGAIELPKSKMRKRPRGPVNDLRAVDVELDEGTVSLIDLARLVSSDDADRVRQLVAESSP